MDYYAVLGLSKGASSDEVKKAFKKKEITFFGIMFYLTPIH